MGRDMSYQEEIDLLKTEGEMSIVQLADKERGTSTKGSCR